MDKYTAQIIINKYSELFYKILFDEDEIVDLKGLNPLQIRELGIHLAFVPEDRLGMGLVGSMDLIDNMMLRSYRSGKSFFLQMKQPEQVANEVVHDLEVVTPSIKTEVKKLSGGNIQKALVGREIAYAPSVFMVAYPVRGLDINSSYTIYNSLNKQKENKGTEEKYFSNKHCAVFSRFSLIFCLIWMRFVMAL